MMPMNSIKIRCLFFVLLYLFASCSFGNGHDYVGENNEHHNQDSIAFSATHHYNIGYNFVLIADSMQLFTTPEGVSLNLDYAPDSAIIRSNEDFVITEIYHVPVVDSTITDSIWLRVGSDGIPLGWVSEGELLNKAAPVDPISLLIFYVRHHDKFILALSFIIILAIAIYIIVAEKKIAKFNKQRVISYYSIAFLLSITAAGVVYSILTEKHSDLWQDFYFHPTLNPLGLQKMLALYLSTIWLSIILWLASIFDLIAKTTLSKTTISTMLHIVFGLAAYTLLACNSFIYLNLVIYIIFVVVIIYKLTTKHRNKAKF